MFQKGTEKKDTADVYIIYTYEVSDLVLSQLQKYELDVKRDHALYDCLLSHS